MAFPRVKSLRGELKRSEIRGNIRYQLTTQEFILQRERRTYRIALENILGLVECSVEEVHTHRFSFFGTGELYKIVTTLLYLVSPTGVIEQHGVSLYARLSSPFVQQMESLLRRPG